MRRFLFLLLLLWIPSLASANEAWRGWCENGAEQVTTSGLKSSTTVQGSHAQCVVTIFVHGGGLATIFSDNNGTPLANPFLSQTNGLWIFYAANGRYDATTSGSSFPANQPSVTYSDILLCDPAASGGSCGAVNSGVNIFKNNVLVGTEIGIDFVEGAGITITPVSDDPTHQRVHLQFNSSSATLCSASAAGIWDVNPQTCAGEKVLQGKSGNPTVINFNVVPASDQTAQNLYTGLGPTSFTATPQNYILGAYNAIVSRNIVTKASPGPYSWGLGVIDEEDGGGTFIAAIQPHEMLNGGTFNTALGMQATCGIVDETGGNHSTVTALCAGVQGEADNFSGTGAVALLAGVSGTIGDLSTGHVTAETDFYAQPYGCHAISSACYAYLAQNNSLANIFQVDLSGNTTGVTIGTFVVTALPACVEGRLIALSNGSTNVWGATVATGGSNHVLAYCDGTNWVVAAK